MRLRREFGPVWHFGGGERLYSNREKQKWESDWERFVDIENTGCVEISCPAEATYSQDTRSFSKTTAQPADPCVIYVSHTVDPFVVSIVNTVRNAVLDEGIVVQFISSYELTDPNKRLEAVTQAKVFVCLIDPDYPYNEHRKAEYTLAASLQLDVVPVLLPSFAVQNFQAWWPAEMTFLEKHSLFVDLRAINMTDDQKAQGLCRSALVPTVRQVLRDWVPKNQVSGTVEAHDQPSLHRQQSIQHAGVAGAIAVEAESVEAAADSGSGSIALLNRAQSSVSREGHGAHAPYTGVDTHYIACEECALEGNRRSTFDRFYCRELLESWKAEELQRRSTSASANASVGDDTAAERSVAICPLTVQCSGASQHELKVVDVLATNVQEMTIPCPRCLSRGILPPFCFQREVCLTELEFNRGGSLLCKRCTNTVPLFELLRSEVFISYNWGALLCPKCTTSYWNAHPLSHATGLCHTCEVRHPKDQSKSLNQMLVSELKQRIEEEAGVTCWQDLDRLVGGKDLVKEMEAGIQCCEVVVVFLTDAYVKSVNCMKEYLFTTKHGKYIIPVLLKDFQGVKLLHQGAGRAREPAAVLSDSAEGPVWWHESMSSLSQFKRILLTEDHHVENVLFEVCERIQSRFHRAQRYATAADAVDFLRDYNQWSQTRRAFVSDHAATLARPEVEEYLRQLFLQMDLDADGFLGEDELAAFLDKSGDSAVFSKEQIAALITEADVDCDGLLSVEEFKSAVITVLEEERQNRGSND